ncbi:ATP-grasp domain-containing protein [Streptomyces sp. MBT53]|uniref:ATP-grasp domain-containing protein n=1 Tax=Streptomyces sp. MBT53 TaxID=1488384 RepID=UPI001911CC3B|nr:ATP-grasp domain-containing protein [Streptomyces sp. MBT53]MBK6013547.1 ATP-grasp domain-containing protein [Streptomyces sp. MBT53]
MTDTTSGRPRRILVTGVGGAPGLDVARRLLALGCEVIAADSDPDAIGLRLPDVTARVTVPARDAGYASSTLRLSAQLRPDAVVSAVEQELPHLFGLRSDLAGLGVTLWLPDLPAIAACTDKARFARVLCDHHIPTPRTVGPDQLDAAPDGPLVVKPRRGQGSKDVIHCRTRAQATVLCELVPDPIVQEQVEGREFTADCLIDREGCASVILRLRLVVKGGLAMVTETFHDAEVEQQVRAVLAATGLVGACCVQGFLCEGGPHRVVIIEANARFGGGFPAAEAAGADLVGQYLNGLTGHPVDHDRLRYRPGVRLTKSYETLAVTEGIAPR